MTNIGKKIRMERIFDRDSKKTIIVPMYHGGSIEPIEGIEDMGEAVDKVARRGANAVVLHKGDVPAGHRGRGKDVGLIVHISSSTRFSDDPDYKYEINMMNIFCCFCLSANCYCYRKAKKINIIIKHLLLLLNKNNHIIIYFITI